MFSKAASYKIKPDAPCGGCGECEYRPGHNATARYDSYSAVAEYGKPEDIHFVAIEAAPATYRALEESPLVQHLKQLKMLTLLHAAGSSKPGTMPFLDCDVGLEFCNGADNAVSSTYSAVNVRTVSVDSLFDELSLERVFWLQVTSSE